MEYKFSEIEEKIKQFWEKENIYYTTDADSGKPKYYVLDMFPYPSGAGLHVGHPLGYIASDIYARYKRMKGFNVLHPMGYDSFGLPAEQYAIQTGQHPAITTEQNIATFRKQMDQLGFSFDWSREVRTSDPKFYKWTQWIFVQLFHSWYNNATNKAEAIENLVKEFEKNGNKNVKAATSQLDIFTADEWKANSAKQQSDILLNYRIAYIADSWVNWCAALGTVLANDEVKDGVSERGGYPVERKLMKQWSLRITAYAERLLTGLDDLNWSDSIKEAQRNWIGKSEGSSVTFNVEGSDAKVEVFTTRPDTIFGVTFLTLAPEHELINQITPSSHKEEVDKYVTYARNRSERERMSEVKKITGQFTGAYAIHPFTGKQVPIWIGEYVLASYGTGAVMGVPAHDSRDYAFAKHFNLPIIEVVKGGDISTEAYEGEGQSVNSSFLDGLNTPEAKKKAIDEIEKKEIGQRKINFKLRDAIFGRQRYWGEPIPIYYDMEGIPHTLKESELPLILPEVDKYLPTEDGEPPLKRANNWRYKGEFDYELTTMPGWAGSSWYYLRYEDPHNATTLASPEKIDYWKNIDFYIGGAEHSTGHLIYFRFWTKFLYDLGIVPFEEPAKRLVNQGMITGMSEKVYCSKYLSNSTALYDLENNDILQVISLSNDRTFQIFYSADIIERLPKLKESMNEVNIPIECVRDNVVNLDQLIKLRNDYADSIFITNDLRYWHKGRFSEFLPGLNVFPEGMKNRWTSENTRRNDHFHSFTVPEKMSKSKYNVVNPDDIVSKYGADCFRLYEMFLGPLELSKPWDTKGIDGVSRFLRKLWRLFYDDNGKWLVTTDKASNEELKPLHKTIKKVEEDMERLSFNTSVSSFMICVNTLTDLKRHKTEVLKDLLLIMAPLAPFTTDFLWRKMEQEGSIVQATFPKYREELLVENVFEYPVAINGKTKAKIELALDLSDESIQKEVLALESVQKFLEGKTPKKVIVVKGRMVNVVV